MSRRQVTAEIAGTVMNVECAIGQSVARDDVLLLLESMKMEIPVVAPSAGRVATVSVAAGDVVQEGQVLVVIEG